MKIRLTVLLLVFAGTTRAELEFSSYMHAGKQSKFVLTDTEDARSSGWLAIGQGFKGYTVTDFDSKSEVLFVRNGETTLKLPLKAARVQDMESTLPELIQQLAVTKVELTEMRKKFTDAHPLVKQHIAKIAGLEKQIARRK